MKATRKAGILQRRASRAGHEIDCRDYSCSSSCARCSMEKEAWDIFTSSRSKHGRAARWRAFMDQVLPTLL